VFAETGITKIPWQVV